MANGTQNIYLPVNGTATLAKQLATSFNLTGNAGWYHLLDISSISNNSRVINIYTKGTANSGGGIFQVFFNRTSGGSTTASEIRWLTTSYAPDTIRWSISNNIMSIYFNKGSNSSFINEFFIISATNRAGTVLNDSIYTWIGTTISEPTTATSAIGAKAQLDANGNQIDTTYLTKTETAASAKSLVSSNSFNGAAKWYDFLELPLQNFDIEILITETVNSNTAGIFRAVYISSDSICKVNWMTYPPDYRRLCYEVTSDKVIFYYYKGSSSSHILQFNVLSSTVGTSVLDLTDYWKAVGQSSTSVTSPPANTTTASIYGNYWAVCNTAAATAAKTVTIPNFPTTIPDGTEIRVYFIYDQSATSPTLNVNGIGAYPVRMYVSSQSAWDVPVDYWTSGDYVTLVFNTNNSCWVVTGKSGRASTGNYGYTKLSSAIDSTATDLAATPSAVKQAYDLAAAALPATSAAVTAGRLQNKISLTGNAGWYRIIQFTIETATNSSRNFILMASESSGVYSGIFKVNFTRTSATAISANIEWLVYDGYSLLDLAYSADATTGVCAIYIKKAQSSTFYLCVQCLYSMTRNSALNVADIGWSASGPLSALPEDAYKSTGGALVGRALQVAPSITWTGAAGWYKVYEESFNTNVERQCQFLISDASGNFTGILNIYYMRTSTTAVSAGARWLSMTGGRDKTKDAQYTMTIENGVATFSLYLRKRSTSGKGMRVVVLAATTNTGGTISVRQFFNPVSATLPSTATNAAPPTGVLRFDAQTVSTGSNAQIISISDTAITDYHVLERIEWANPEYITSGYTWTTSDGSFTINGTCTAATTANIVLARRGN